MNDEDTAETVYTVAYRGDKFLMVWNRKRNGWEMPGGHVKKGESIEEAAQREFQEESGYSINIIETRDLGHCHVCSAVLGDKVASPPEMRSELFDDIPAQLFFDKQEYEEVIPWSLNSVRHNA